MPDLEDADLANINGAHVLKELDDLALKFKLVRRCPGGEWILGTELHAPDSQGPGIEQQFTVTDPKALKAAEAQPLHSSNKGPLAGQQIIGGY